MKKILLALFFALTVAGANAQVYEKGAFYAVEMSYFYTPSGELFGKNLPFMSPSFGFRVGYNFNRNINVGAGLSAPFSLFNNNDARTFSAGLEGSLSTEFELLRIRERASLRLELSAGGVLVSDNNWKYLYYGSQLKYALPSAGGIAPAIGLGVRYYDSLNAAFGSRWTVGATLTFYFDLGGKHRLRNADSLNY